MLMRKGPATTAGSIPTRRQTSGTTQPKSAAHVTATMIAAPIASAKAGSSKRVPRRTRLAAMLALLNLLVSVPANRLEAQESFEGKSIIYDLPNLLKSDEIKKSIARFKMAVSGLKNAAGEAKVIVQDATRAFEQARSRKTEADLIVANARAVKVQFHALEEFRTAARDQEQAIDGVLVKLQRGKEALGGEIEEIRQEKTVANEKAGKGRDVLTKLAVAANLAGKKGKLTSDMIALIKHLNWSHEQELQVGKDAAIVQQEAEGRLRKFDDIVASLRKTKTNLGYSAGAAVTLQANLSRVARWQARALTWRQLVDNSAALSQSMPTDITEFIPKVRYPGLPGRPAPVVKGKEDSLATDEQEATEILKRFLPKPAKKKTVVKEAPAAKKTAAGKSAAAESSKKCMMSLMVELILGFFRTLCHDSIRTVHITQTHSRSLGLRPSWAPGDPPRFFTD